MNPNIPGLEGAALSAPGSTQKQQPPSQGHGGTGVTFSATQGADGAAPSRKRPAHMPVVDTGNLSPIVFLTVCTKDHCSLFASPDVHALLTESWRAAEHWHVGRYVVMPDHIHLFCCPATRPPESLRSWVKYWKTLVSRRWPRPSEHPIWQQDVWDTQLRSGESYSGKWQYVRENPVRAGLAERSDDWPYQGELNMLPWHDR